MVLPNPNEMEKAKVYHDDYYLQIFLNRTKGRIFSNSEKTQGIIHFKVLKIFNHSLISINYINVPMKYIKK